MNTLYKLSILLLSILVFIWSCEKNPAKPDYKKEICVIGYLWGDNYLTVDHAIYISYTQPVTQSYDFNIAGIHNADVRIINEASGDTTILSDAAEKPGFYYNDHLFIQPKTTYHLFIKIDNVTVTASTTVPPVLGMVSDLSTDTVNVVSQTNLGFAHPVKLSGENENQIILVDMFCHEEYYNAEYIYPAHDHNFPDDQEEYDQGENGEPRHIFAYMMLKDVKSNLFGGEYLIYWYDSMIVFYGLNTMKILAIDENYHRYLYELHPELCGGINGGIGVFGSVYGEKFELTVVK